MGGGMEDRRHGEGNVRKKEMNVHRHSPCWGDGDKEGGESNRGSKASLDLPGRKFWNHARLFRGQPPTVVIWVIPSCLQIHCHRRVTGMLSNMCPLKGCKPDMPKSVTYEPGSLLNSRRQYAECEF